MFKTCVVVSLFLIGINEVVGSKLCVGSDRLLKRLWPEKHLTSSYGDVLKPQKAKPDESMPDDSKVPALPSLADNWRGAIRSVNPKPPAKYVAITLDYCELCTNINGYQSQVIKYLREQNMPATLFISGKWMRSHTEITQQLMVDPLFEIGNHAWSHANFGIASREVIDQQILATQAQYILLRDQIAQKALAVGMEEEMDSIPLQPILFRLPYGRCNDAALQRLQCLGLKVIQWNHVGLEGYPATQPACEAFVDKVHNGSIILLHGNHVPKHTLSFLQKIIPLLCKKGFTFLTVSELLETGSAVIEQDGYFIKPGDNLSLDTQFGYMGTGVQK